MQKAIYLASQSPRRKALLAQLGIDFTQISVEVDETPLADETPEQLVARLALLKAQAGKEAGYNDKPVLGSDTVVVSQGKALGKPKDFADFSRMMHMLSGQQHSVLTAIALVNSKQQMCKVVETTVTFKPLSPQEISDYWQTGEPQDKAGGYGIQGKAGAFVTQLNGSYFAVVGLPLYETQQLLIEFNHLTEFNHSL